MTFLSTLYIVLAACPCQYKPLWLVQSKYCPLKVMQVFKGKWKDVEYLMTVYNFSPTHQNSISLTGNTYSYICVSLQSSTFYNNYGNANSRKHERANNLQQTPLMNQKHFISDISRAFKSHLIDREWNRSSSE